VPRSGFLQGGYKEGLFIADLVAEHPELIESFPFALRVRFKTAT
jgi:hypothetical protein